jgi:flavin-dependent dehydrogenase
MKVVIIGSSIAGASAALLLAGKANVVVYEQKARKDIGKKVCLNNVTASFLGHARKLGLKPEKYLASISNKSIIKSPNNEVGFRTKEFKIDRAKLVEDLIRKAEKKGARFYFNIEFVDVIKNNKFRVTLKKGKQKINDYADILIGADGALSKVSKKAGLWKNRKLYLILQKEVPLNRLKLKIEKNTYYVYIGRKYGYFSYIFPYKGKAVIGLADKTETANAKFKMLLKELKLDSKNLSAALVPEPKIIAQKNNLFLIGDAGCNVKFSGGGIIPAITSAFAVKEAIINKNCRELKKMRKKIFINKLILKAIKKMGDNDFDSLLETMKDSKFFSILEKRDELEKKDYLKLLDLRLMRFIPKLL